MTDNIPGPDKYFSPSCDVRNLLGRWWHHSSTWQQQHYSVFSSLCLQLCIEEDLCSYWQRRAYQSNITINFLSGWNEVCFTAKLTLLVCWKRETCVFLFNEENRCKNLSIFLTFCEFVYLFDCVWRWWSPLEHTHQLKLRRKRLVIFGNLKVLEKVAFLSR